MDDVLKYLEEARPLYFERKKKRRNKRIKIASLVALGCCLAVSFFPFNREGEGFYFVLYDDEAFNALLYEDQYSIAEYEGIPLDGYGLLALNI